MAEFSEFGTLKLWLDASDTDTVITSGTAVTEFHDKSGNDNHFYQATSTNRPIYGATTQNGLNTMQLAAQSGQQRCLIHPTKSTWSFLTGDAGCTIFEVAKWTTGGTNQGSFGNTFQSSGSTMGLRSTQVSTSAGLIAYRNGGTIVNQNTDDVADDVWAIRAYRILPNSATGLLLRVNDEELFTAAVSTATFTTPEYYMTVGSAGASATSGTGVVSGPSGGMELASLLIYEGIVPLGPPTQHLNDQWNIFSSQSDIPFLQANDRYQVITLANQGTSIAIPEFRYWFAGAPLWEFSLMSDAYIPPYHTLDEYSTYPAGSIETPFKLIKTGQEDQIDGVFVEFYARPTAITEATVTSTYSVGFTCRVEGMAVPGWERTVTSTTTYATTSGVIVSDDQTYASEAAQHASDTWPNLRSVYLPFRLLGKVRAARVILTDIHLVAIHRIQLVGKSMSNRNP